MSGQRIGERRERRLAWISGVCVGVGLGILGASVWWAWKCAAAAPGVEDVAGEGRQDVGAVGAMVRCGPERRGQG